MFQSHFGEIAALLTAVFWTATSMSFEAAGKRIGSLTVNLLRLYLAYTIYSVYLYFTRGMIFPTDASAHAWLWLSISGIVGFAIGDLLLFQAFVVVGARISMLIMALVPPITALIGWIILGETLTLLNISGMLITITGVVLVVLKRELPGADGKNKKFKFSYPIGGLLLAFGGALGQAVGLVLSKYGMGDYNAFAASQIRVLAGLVGFTLIFFFMKRWHRVLKSFSNKKGMMFTVIGSVFGPFLGVSFSLLAIQYTNTGVAATIMSIVPVLIIPPAIIFFKEKIYFKEVIGAALAVGGVGILFLS